MPGASELLSLYRLSITFLTTARIPMECGVSGVYSCGFQKRLQPCPAKPRVVQPAADVHGFSLGHSFPALLVCISCTTTNMCRTSQSQSHLRAAFGYDTCLLHKYAYPNVTSFIPSSIHSSGIAYNRMILQTETRIFHGGARCAIPTRYGRGS